MSEQNLQNDKVNDDKRLIEKALRLIVKKLTDPDPLVRKQACMGLEAVKDDIQFLDLLSIRLHRRWKSWKRGKPGRDYAWLARGLVMSMSEIAEEKQAGARGKIMEFERRLLEREALGDASSAEAWIEQATTLL